MRERFSVLIDDSQGALMRVIGTIERRGWRVQALAMAPHGNRGSRLELEVAPAPWHRGDIAVLARHLEKLIPVEAVERDGLDAGAWRGATAMPAPLALGA